MAFVWLVFLTALAVRLGYVLVYPQVAPVYGDDRMYDEVGWNLTRGRGFVGGFAAAVAQSPEAPEVGIGPTYPAFLALVYRVAGHDLRAVRVVQAILSAGLVLILFAPARRAFGQPAARIAAVLVALYPPFVIYSGMLLTETLFAFSLAFIVRVVSWAARSAAAWPWGVAGLLAGVVVLLRQETLVVIAVFAAVVWWFRGRRMVGRLVAFGLITVLTIGVWTVRNYVVFGEIILVSAHGGDILWISTRDWTEWHYDDLELKSLVQGLSYVEQNNVLRREGLRNIVNDPLGYLALCFRRLPHFWISSHTSYLVGFTQPFLAYWEQGALGRLAVKLALLALNVALLTLAVWGIAVSFRAPSSWTETAVLFLVPVVVIALVHFFLFAAPRYQMPAMTFLLHFAAVPLAGRSPAPISCPAAVPPSGAPVPPR